MPRVTERFPIPSISAICAATFTCTRAIATAQNTLEEMIEACAARGYAYHAISDHSQFPMRGGDVGLTPEAARKQREHVRSLGERFGIRTLCASEVDVRPDGSLVFDERTLSEFDLVIASVHTGTNASRDEMTRRIIAACENPYVSIIGHPTGRYVDANSEFGGYEFDYDAVFAAAARTGTALEIDGHPARLDLPSALARRAKAFGVTFTCDSDAHSAAALSNVSYAVGSGPACVARGLGRSEHTFARGRPDVRSPKTGLGGSPCE